MSTSTSGLGQIRLSRRQLLVATPVATLQFVLPRPHSASERSDVVVVGAGVSGLAAARAFSNQGLKVIVIEARNRIGGRVWTDFVDGWPLDLGASWIYGVTGNPITKLARDFRLDVMPTNYNNHWRYRSGGVISRGDEAIESQFDDLMSAVDQTRERRQNSGQPDISLQQGIIDTSNGRALNDVVNYAINTNIEHEFGSDISQLSLYNYDQGEAFGGADVLFPRGYGQIPANLGLGQDIRLGRVVQRVEHSAKGVRIITNKDTFEAPRAVITLPLGVLKTNTVQFNPALPQRKLQAIRRLGSGVLNKCYLRFSRVFWPKDPDLMGYISAQRGEWAEWLNVQHYLGEPILLGFNAGSFGAQLEKQSDSAIVASAMRALRSMFGANIPEPTGFRLTRWANDPFARGAYSFAAIGATGDDYVALSEPVDNRLFFAGEATSREYAATVHGAFLSGVREAERVLALR